MTYDLLITQRIEPPARATDRREAGIGRMGPNLGERLRRLRSTLLAAMASWPTGSGQTTAPRQAEPLIEPRIAALVFLFR